MHANDALGGRRDAKPDISDADESAAALHNSCTSSSFVYQPTSFVDNYEKKKNHNGLIIIS